MEEELILGFMGVLIPLSLIVGGFALGFLKMRNRHDLELARLRAEQGDAFYGLGAVPDGHDLTERVDRLEAKVDRVLRALESEAVPADPAPRRLEAVDAERAEPERSVLAEL